MPKTKLNFFLVGSTATGKTTLADAIASLHPEYAILPSVTRELLASKYDGASPDPVTQYAKRQSFQRNLAYAQCASILWNCDKTANRFNGVLPFVADRSIDALAYSSLHCDTGLCDEVMDTVGGVVDIMRGKRSGVPTAVLFLRPQYEWFDRRSQAGLIYGLTWSDIIAVDAKLEMLLDLWQIPYFSIATPSMKERMRIVSSLMAMHDRNVPDAGNSGSSVPATPFGPVTPPMSAASPTLEATAVDHNPDWVHQG